jgi:GMP synthase-like glutamine amidotransferase
MAETSKSGPGRPEARNRLLIVKNSTNEGTGRLEALLRTHKIANDTVDLEAGDWFPDPRPYAGVVVFGGPDSANDRTVKIMHERARVRETITNNIPYLGVCLGMQILAKVSGGRVYRAPNPEIGWYPMELTREGAKDPLFRGVNPPLNVLQVHRETVRTHGTMKVLAIGSPCAIQAVTIGETAYGIQGNLHLDNRMFDCWTGEDKDLRQLSRSQLVDQYNSLKERYEFNADMILTNFLRIAGLVGSVGGAGGEGSLVQRSLDFVPV